MVVGRAAPVGNRCYAMMCWEGRGKTCDPKNSLNKDTKEQMLCGFLQI